ncbi:CBS domain-containing protein [Pontibacterium sp. N1Y112]|uniref:CBS domain-containing protein n=1 Tax=Pontibacterium sinense TaxID=2781979 RepID=A0A8J7FCH8_9GAMM|nr:CBS domain-containing protein [Pontibacterium sinense]MBE9398507.1 CBS domain-containing protein [Pontibacterium sinense]
MFQEFYPIRLSSLDSRGELVTPDHDRHPGTLRSPALEVMTDFERSWPVKICETTQIDEALEHMKAQHVRMLFAVDSQDQFSGIVSAADIAGDKPMSVMGQNNWTRDQVEVRHLMLDVLHIKALTYDQVRCAKIGDVMLTLKSSGDQHVIVTSANPQGGKKIRGIISASDISRYLCISFDVMYQAKSFAEIERLVSRGQEF